MAKMVLLDPNCFLQWKAQWRMVPLHATRKIVLICFPPFHVAKHHVHGTWRAATLPKNDFFPLSRSRPSCVAHGVVAYSKQSVRGMSLAARPMWHMEHRVVCNGWSTCLGLWHFAWRSSHEFFKISTLWQNPSF